MILNNQTHLENVHELIRIPNLEQELPRLDRDRLQMATQLKEHGLVEVAEHVERVATGKHN